MPVEAAATAAVDRAKVTHLEAIGRLLAGIAPWLEHGAESGRRGRACAAARRPAPGAPSTPPPTRRRPTACNFDRGGRQPLVDAAFLGARDAARAERALGERSPAATESNLVAAMASTRRITPGFSNWLLFTAMVEAAWRASARAGTAMRVDYALRQHDQWYKGDGVYGDGPSSTGTTTTASSSSRCCSTCSTCAVEELSPVWDAFATVVERARGGTPRSRSGSSRRTGTFPPIGRSLAYRFGAFQLLGADGAAPALPDGVSPAQVRAR